MKKEFIKYEQALALKELGFNEPCFGYWNIDPYLPNPTFNLVKPFDHEWCIPAPLYQQAFRWFREKDYYSEIRVGCTQIDGGIGYEWWVWKPNGIEEWSIQIPGEEWSYETYEEAESACLDKLIEIIKNK